MKKATILLLMISFFLQSCSEPGTSTLKLDETEQNLPPELKGLKVYLVKTSLGSVKVAVLNEQANSITYRSGKTTQSVIMINQQTGKVYQVKDILIENDSIIVARK